MEFSVSRNLGYILFKIIDLSIPYSNKQANLIFYEIGLKSEWVGPK